MVASSYGRLTLVLLPSYTDVFKLTEQAAVLIEKGMVVIAQTLP